MAKKRYESVWDALETDPHEAEHLKVRSALLIALQERVAGLNLTQAQVAKKLGIHQPRVSDLMAGKIDAFSIDSLIDYASNLGMKVHIQADEVAA